MQVDQEVDTRGLNCPLPILKAKKALATMQSGQLLKVVAIKGLCREANVAKIDVGPKGAVVTFRGDEFKNPMGLVGFVQKNQVAWKIRPDHKVVVKGEWETPEQRLAAAERVLSELAKLAA